MDIGYENKVEPVLPIWSVEKCMDETECILEAGALRPWLLKLEIDLISETPQTFTYKLIEAMIRNPSNTVTTVS